LNTQAKSITLSVVSHGHSDLIGILLETLAHHSSALIARVVVTSNMPELDDFSQLVCLAQAYPFELQLIENSRPLGFGANQNQAFRHCETDHFCIINPDIEIVLDPFVGLVKVLSQPDVGIAYPSQLDESLELLDFERELVTLVSLARRHICGQRYKQQAGLWADWVSGAFMAFNSSIFRDLGGFDESYFMYCEDVDICLRVQLAGYKLAKSDTAVIHHTQRSTLKSWKHLQWHVLSLLSLWVSLPYRQFKKRSNQNV
jgi:N-acetylglucosaminyl-diphospho-decaprenol L-rhamnosyltransferase